MDRKSVMSSFVEQLHQEKAELAARDADPLREKVEALVRGMEAISTAALLDWIDLPATTGNARRLSKTMRALGFVAVKSRQFMPGGWRDSVTRGWCRPVRAPTFKRGNKVESLHPKSDRTGEQKACHVMSEA